jgi:hypothetical protein
MNRLRGEITEYRLGRAATPEALVAAGWSRNDLEMLARWFYTGPAVFGPERIWQAHAALRALPPEGAAATLRRVARAAGRAVTASAAPLLLALGLACLVRDGPVRRRLAYGAGLTVATLVLVDLAFKEAPPRLAAPLWTTTGVALLRWLGPASLARGAAARGLGALLLLAAVALALVPVADTVRARDRWTARLTRDLDAAPRAALYLDVGGGFPWELAWRPFRPAARPLPRLLPIGGAAYSPLVAGFVAREGVTDLALALCTDPGWRLLASSLLLPAIVRYVQEHFALAVTIRPEYQGPALTVYRCEPVPSTGAGPPPAAGSSSTASPMPVRP